MMLPSSSALYPVCIVREKEDMDAAWSGWFTDFESKKSSPFPTRFRVWTESDLVILQIEAEQWQTSGEEELLIYWDPAHSGRSPHNAVKWSVSEQKGMEYFRYEYEYTPYPLPLDMELKLELDEQRRDARWTIRFPMQTLGICKTRNRVIGFNLFRKKRGHEHLPHTKWSGLPGDNAIHGQGAGDLLFVCGLEETEIEKLKEQAISASETIHTRWEKGKIPESVYSDVKEKTKGFTCRISHKDAEKAKWNSENTSWGSRIKKIIMETADFWAGKEDEELLKLVPSGNPRASTPGAYFGDPLHGGNYRSLQACLERPYQFYNPATGEWWYNGKVVKNPATGEDVVFYDDGSGFLAPEGFPNPGVRYMFTAAYRLFLWSMLLSVPYCPVIQDKTACPESSGTQYAGAIPNMAYAYLLTGDSHYARKALILIGRMMELLPYMNGNYGDGSFSDTVYLSEPSTTESFYYSNLFEALDLLFDTIDGFQPELEALFTRFPDGSGFSRTAPFHLKKTVQETIPYILYSCRLQLVSRNDWSIRYLYLTLELACYMENGKLMDELLYRGPNSLEGKIRNAFYRDGRYAYDSIFYVQNLCVFMMSMGNVNYGFSDGDYFQKPINLFEDAEFGYAEIVKLAFKLKCGELIPSFGDTYPQEREPNASRVRGLIDYQEIYEITYSRMPSARQLIGQVMAAFEPEELEMSREGAARLHRPSNAILLLATAPSTDEYIQFREFANERLPTYFLEDSETSILRSGKNARNMKHVILYGQPSAPHSHGDKLGLWIGAYGYHMLSGAGGYPFTWISPKFRAWEVHSAACSVVVIDGNNQRDSFSKARGHFEGHLIQGSGLLNEAAYPGNNMERWVWLIQAPDQENAYVIDVNAISGNGQVMDYNTPGLHLKWDEIEFDGVPETDWVPLTGTLAGKDVPLYSTPGYGWMKAHRKADISSTVSWTFRFDHAALRVHAVSQGESREIICASGELGGQEMGKAQWVPFILWRKLASDSGNHNSIFTLVYEPYHTGRFLRSVNSLETISEGQGVDRAAAMEVIHADGIRDIWISGLHMDAIHSFRDSQGRIYHTDARMLIARYSGETIVHIEAYEFRHIEVPGFIEHRSSAAYEGFVNHVDVERRILEIDLVEPVHDVAGWEGRIGMINSPGYAKPSPYYLREPRVERGKLIFRVDPSLIIRDVDPYWMRKYWRWGRKRS